MYEFVFTGNPGDKNAGWWLTVTSLEQLYAYHEWYGIHYEHALDNIRTGKEFNNDTLHHSKYMSALELAGAIFQIAKVRHMSIVDAMIDIRATTLRTQVRALKTHKKIYINRSGGWCWHLSDEVTDTRLSGSLDFPAKKGA